MEENKNGVSDATDLALERPKCCERSGTRPFQAWTRRNCMALPSRPDSFASDHEDTSALAQCTRPKMSMATTCSVSPVLNSFKEWTFAQRAGAHRRSRLARHRNAIDANETAKNFRKTIKSSTEERMRKKLVLRNTLKLNTRRRHF